VAKAVSADGPPTYVRVPQDSGIKARDSCAAAGEPADACDGVGRAGGLVGVAGMVPGERGQDPAGVCPS
jgi:hypothetical protein